MQRIGLVMASGGARAAYQAGVLKRLGELREGSSPFSIIEGVSAGAINASAIAVGARDFRRCTAWLARMWSNLRPSAVFRTDLPTLTFNALRWIVDLTFGGAIGGGRAHSLLNAAPLRKLLAAHHDEQEIARNIARGYIDALAVVATDYASGRTCVFVQGRDTQHGWYRARRAGMSTRITVDHLCASAAIPVVFSPVALQTPQGRSWFGDGCLRLPAPLGPVLRLGADRVLAIGLRHPEGAVPMQADGPKPSLARVLEVSLSALFMDQLDSDCEHLQRINELLEHEGMASLRGPQPMRRVPTLCIVPSVDLGAMAQAHFTALPPQVRYLLGGLGVSASSNMDLVSYLLFDRTYTAAVVEAGWRDADDRIDEIVDFLRA